MIGRSWFFVSEERPASPWWMVGSVLAHAIMVTGVVIAAGRLSLPARDVRFITLSPEPAGDRAADVSFSSRVSRPSAAIRPAPMRSPGAAPSPKTETPVVAEPRDTSRGVAIAETPPAPVRETRGEASDTIIGTGRHLGPAYATGRLWDRPGANGIRPPAAASEGLDPATHVSKVDSAVVARINAFLSALPADSFAPPKPQKWTTEIDGRTWGMDGSWIYLGGIKIPSLILALLPLPSGNYDEAKKAEQLQSMRADIMQSAWRAENMADFRRYVKETRERRDRERAAERARRVVARDSL